MDEVQEYLKEIREAICAALPEAEERISWNKQEAERLRAVCARKLGYTGEQECRKYGAGGVFYGK